MSIPKATFGPALRPDQEEVSYPAGSTLVCARCDNKWIAETGGTATQHNRVARGGKPVIVTAATCPECEGLVAEVIPLPPTVISTVDELAAAVADGSIGPNLMLVWSGISRPPFYIGGGEHNIVLAGDFVSEDAVTTVLTAAFRRAGIPNVHIT